MLPFGVHVPAQIPIVLEFCSHYSKQKRQAAWRDGRTLLRVHRTAKDDTSDDFYMHILPKGRDGAQIDIISAPMDKGNGIAYTVNMVVTNNRIGFPPRVPEYETTDICIAVWNCRDIARASFMPNLTGLLALTRATVMVVTDIRVGDNNAREIL
ncbi:hypothetical protein Cgig2_019277 [Carnegiea gigantea]|uniref:Uncharacterized protein n=1 Tax=Carnegiea gigantea TaxID=171969 RepID=A0A9Q1QLQ9_9CARY|nr:hypothetical protein Cgig2_019277 [Carnegiea gigantea]